MTEQDLATQSNEEEQIGASPLKTTPGCSDMSVLPSDTAPSAGSLAVGQSARFYYQDTPDRESMFILADGGGTDFALGRVDVCEPMGKMLVGSEVGDQISVSTPLGVKLLVITAIGNVTSKQQAIGVDTISKPKKAVSPQTNVFPTYPGLGESAVLRDDDDDSPEDESAPLDGESNVTHIDGDISTYRSWTSRPLADPRETRPREILTGLLEIIEAEGPIFCERAFQLYCYAANLGKLGSEIRHAIDKALNKALRDGSVISTNELRTKDRFRNVLTATNHSNSLPRIGGNRNFVDIPPSEVGQMMRLVLNKFPHYRHYQAELYRRVVLNFGFKRVSSKFKRHLDAARVFSQRQSVVDDCDTQSSTSSEKGVSL